MLVFISVEYTTSPESSKNSIEFCQNEEIEIIETKPITEVPAKPIIFDSVVTIFHTVARNESIESIAEDEFIIEFILKQKNTE